MRDYVTQVQKIFHPSGLILTELITVREISVLHKAHIFKTTQRIKHGFLHNVSNLDDITSPVQILELDNLFERYGSKLGCRSLCDTLYGSEVCDSSPFA